MPYAAPTRCLVTGCAEHAVARGRCADHYIPWEQRSANSRTLTGADRARFRAAVLRRDPTCRACGTAPSTEADHVIPIAQGGAHTDPANGQGLCLDCHAKKTAAENAARNRARAQSRNAR